MPVNRTSVGLPFSLTIDANNAVLLDGATQYGDIPNYASLDSLATFTYEFYFYEDSTETTTTLIRFQNGATRYATIQNDNGNNDVLGLVDYVSADGFGGNSGSIFTTDAWHHWACVHNGTTRTIANYIDGALVSNSFSQAGSGAQVGFSGSNIFIGFNGSTGFFKGRMAYQRIWTTVRTLAEINANKDYYLDPPQENLTGTVLIGNWNFNLGAGTSVENTASPGTGDLSLVGTPSWTTGPSLTAKPYNGPRVLAGNRTLAGTRTLVP